MPVIAAIVLFLLLAAIAFGIVCQRIAAEFALSAIHPKRIGYGEVLTQEIKRNHIDPALMDLKYDKLFLKNARGQELTARLYPTQTQTNRYILFLHGYNYPWVGVLKYLSMLNELGFNVLVPDLQSQGESEGNYITFGALESDDALEWLEQIQLHARDFGFEQARIGIMGESMGAVTALMTAAKANSTAALESKPLFCVADCPFSDWDSMILLLSQKRYRINLSFILPLVKAIIRNRSGADMNAVSAVKAAADIHVPVLLFHGTHDPLVPYSMSEQIAKANPDNITLCLIEGAKHMNCIAVNPQEYRRRFTELLRQVHFENEVSEDFSIYL